MKRGLKIGIMFVSMMLLIVACQEDEPTLEELVAPSNLTVSADVSIDGSGLVDFTASADNALSYRFTYSDGSTEDVSLDGLAQQGFFITGINTYQVTIVAFGTGGLSTSTTIEIEVESSFSDNPRAELLTGGRITDGVVTSASQKNWYIDAREPGHLGVGATFDFLQDQFTFPGFFSASPFNFCPDVGMETESSCYCEAVFTFALADSGQITMVNDNGGRSFFNQGHKDLGGGTNGGADECFDFDTSETSVVILSPSQSMVPEDISTKTEMTFSNDGFLGYYVSSFSYEILSLTENSMAVRTRDQRDFNLAWYQILTTTPPAAQREPDASFETQFTALQFSEEFDVDGAPDTATWSYDIGTGDNGWGNNELQYYTDRSENVIVSDGTLKITAQTESFMGSNYTSTRLQSQDKFEFTFGRAEIRAKLPTGVGTWPAIWMLGNDFETNIWPGVGEMDIMEHVGRDQDVILSTTHDQFNFGGTGRTGSTDIVGVSDEFHNYSMEWREDEIIFLVDDVVFHTVSNDSSLPFNKDFFFILNVAMGGTLGGDIDAAFVGSTMEVDYIRVYQ